MDKKKQASSSLYRVSSSVEQVMYSASPGRQRTWQLFEATLVHKPSASLLALVEDGYFCTRRCDTCFCFCALALGTQLRSCSSYQQRLFPRGAGEGLQESDSQSSPRQRRKEGGRTETASGQIMMSPACAIVFSSASGRCGTPKATACVGDF